MNTDPDSNLNDLAKLYPAVVCDILDEAGYRNQALPPEIRPLTGASRLWGRAFTVHAARVESIPEEPYKLEIQAIDALQAGEIMVTDLENYTGCGFWGELMTTACLHKGVHGAVFSGCTRDVWKLKDLDFPVFGLGYHPADSKGRIDIDRIREPIQIGSVTVSQGDYLLGDQDGVVAIPFDIADDIIRLAREKVAGENTARRELQQGVPLGEVFAKHGIL